MFKNQSASYSSPIYIVDGLRTPFLKARGPGPFSASDLAMAAGRELLSRQPFDPSDLDEVILGSVMPSAEEANIARLVALRLGCGNAVTAWTVQRNCASGMQALDSACLDISTGRADLVLAGGTEAMSRAPLLVNEKMIAWMTAFKSSKSFAARFKLITQLRPYYFVPVIALLRGLSDPLFGVNMGQTAENLAYRFGITREQMDEFSAMSHQRCANAEDQGFFTKEMMALYDSKGHCYLNDQGLRRDSTSEKLAKLPPFFDKKFGMVTAGNSSQISDGAALLILASEMAVKRYQLPVLGCIVDAHWAGLAPQEMGLGPVHAIVPLLQRHGLAIEDIDYWEINEAFAAQVLACLKAFEDPEYCSTQFGGLSGAFGTIDPARLNVDGGAIAIGHPVGASGARLVLHLLQTLHRQNAKRGVASLCIGGGQGGAMLIERLTEIPS